MITQADLFKIQFKRGYLRFWKGKIEDHEAKNLADWFQLPKKAITDLTAKKFFEPEEVAEVLNSFEIGRFIVTDEHWDCNTQMRDYEIFLLGLLD